METPDDPFSLNYRIREGISRMAMVVRVDEWNRAKALGINPTQLAILTLLDAHRPGMAVREIAVQLGVSQPTATDSINALQRKGLLLKRPNEADGRSVTIEATSQGLGLLETNIRGGLAEQAVASLTLVQQQDLLLSLIEMIRHLQEADAIPVQRMCVTCKFFVPFAHDGRHRPHHCKLVDAAFGQRELRVDCREHELADPASRAATWDTFKLG